MHPEFRRGFVHEIPGIFRFRPSAGVILQERSDLTPCGKGERPKGGADKSHVRLRRIPTETVQAEIEQKNKS